MKRLLSLGVAALLALTLTACGGQDPTVTESPATAETSQAVEATTAAAWPTPEGPLYRVGRDIYFYFNAGDCCYELLDRDNFMLVSVIDYETATQRPLCSVPGCTHDSESCPAYLPAKSADSIIFTAGEKVYVYHPASSLPYTGSWEQYYQENVLPGLQDPALREGMNEREFEAYHRGLFVSRTQPAGLYVLDKAGTSRRFQPLSQNLDDFVRLYWCDGARLYGCRGMLDSQQVSQGYCVSLADGTVTDLPLEQGEIILEAGENCLFTERLVGEEPLQNLQGEALQAALQQAKIEICRLSLPDGTRSKVAEFAYLDQDGIQYRPLGCQGGKVYCSKEQCTADGSKVLGFWSCDLTTGDFEPVLEPLAQASMMISSGNTTALPGTAQQQGRYLWFTGSSGFSLDLAWVLDTANGELTAVQQTLAGDPYQRAVRGVGVTDDGRFLIGIRRPDPEGPDYEYGLIDVEAFLQGSTDYTPVTTIQR